MDILERLDDLQMQATTEESHFYVAKTCQLARNEIVRLRIVIDSIEEMIRTVKEP